MASIALAVSALAGVAGSVGGGIIGSNASSKAAAQEAAASNAAQPQIEAGLTEGNNDIYTAEGAANDTLASVYGATQPQYAPYMAAGANQVNALNTELQPGGQLNTPFTAAQMESYDPGYAFTLQQGQQALERSAAARGTELTGGTLKDLTTFSQGTALQGYTQALQNYQSQNQQLYNQQMGLVSAGQNAVAGNTQLGEWYGGGVSSNLTNAAALRNQNFQTSSNERANLIMGQGNAQAAGTVGSANAWSSALSGATNAVSQAGALSYYYGNNTGAPTINNSTSIPGITAPAALYNPSTSGLNTGYSANPMAGYQTQSNPLTELYGLNGLTGNN